MHAARVCLDEFEQELQRVRQSTKRPEEGVFGPASMRWRVDREALVFLGAGRALLLQLAHPWVSTAIAEHSSTLADPIGRFHRTFHTVYTLVFGSLDQSLHMARRLHLRHAGVQGHLPEGIGPSYFANEVSALMWVHATLIDTALLVHDLVLPPLSPQEREIYYQDSRRLGALFGIPSEHQPANFTAFETYVGTQLRSDVLTVSPVARVIAGQVLRGGGSWLLVPGWYRALTASLLPESLQDDFGLSGTSGTLKTAESALSWIRHTYPQMPARVRRVGPYQEALQRIEGRGPDQFTRLLNRFWIGQPCIGAGGAHGRKVDGAQVG